MIGDRLVLSAVKSCSASIPPEILREPCSFERMEEAAAEEDECLGWLTAGEKEMSCRGGKLDDLKAMADSDR